MGDGRSARQKSRAVRQLDPIDRRVARRRAPRQCRQSQCHEQDATCCLHARILQPDPGGRIECGALDHEPGKPPFHARFGGPPDPARTGEGREAEGVSLWRGGAGGRGGGRRVPLRRTVPAPPGGRGGHGFPHDRRTGHDAPDSHRLHRGGAQGGPVAQDHVADHGAERHGGLPRPDGRCRGPARSHRPGRSACREAGGVGQRPGGARPAAVAPLRRSCPEVVARRGGAGVRRRGRPGAA